MTKGEKVYVVENHFVEERTYPSGKHTLNGRRETSLEIVRPVSASGSKLWG